MLPQFVVDAMRSGVPVVGALMTPVVARERGKNVSTVARVAAYSFGGWAAGYALQRAFFWALDTLGQRSLPTEVSSLQGLQPPPTPKLQVNTPKEQTQVEAQNEGVREIEQTDNVVPMKIQSHMKDAYGSEA